MQTQTTKNPFQKARAYFAPGFDVDHGNSVATALQLGLTPNCNQSFAVIVPHFADSILSNLV